MRSIVMAIIFIWASSLTLAQDNPYENIVGRDTPPMLVSEDDDKVTARLKECYNATWSEVRARYDRWKNGGWGDVRDLLDALERFQIYRMELEGEMDQKKFVEQKLALVKELAALCRQGESKLKLEIDREFQELRIKSFLCETNLELERLTADSTDRKR